MTITEDKDDHSILSSNKQVNISQWIANAIADTGCRVVYGGHGGALVPLVNAVVEHPRLTWVCARNEHDAATMAAAHAKFEGNLGVVIATSGPGASNLTTGLMEACMDEVPLLAITGMKPRAQLGYAEFQDIDQSKLFSGAGLEFSKSASSAESTIPLLRDACSTALSRRTCAHLAIPVDIQAAPSPLPLKAFCAAYANERIQMMQKFGGDHTLDEAAEFLGGAPDEPHPRTIICAGLGAIPPRHPRSKDNGESRSDPPDMSKILLEFAEALNAPILTRLHAKGLVDETHPLSFGVVGVHGKPGLEAAASLISSADIVVCIGVEDATLLVCNMAGIQIRDMVEIQPDAFGVSTRFHANMTLLGDVAHTVTKLTDKIGALSWKRDKQAAIREAQQQVGSKIEVDRSSSSKQVSSGHLHRHSVHFDEFDQFEHMAGQQHVQSTMAKLLEPKQTVDGSNVTTVNHEDIVQALKNKSDKLWKDLHTGKVCDVSSTLRILHRHIF
jgi:thiamine pyrophosphate-dependent acetolactate synthase large subunit-like protein